MASLKKPTEWDDLYPGRFIRAGDLKGREVTLTLADIELEELVDPEGKTGVKTIFCFTETAKKHVACKTNGICCREMFGKKLSDWLGKRVTFRQEQWNGEPAIRIAGSPDISADMTITIQLPRRRPTERVLKRIAPRKREPGED
jgi:hypothetical protein